MTIEAKDWNSIESAPANVRVRVAHNLDPSSLKVDSICKTTGILEDDKWVCSAAFVCIDGRLRWNPTHWLPEEREAA